VSNNFSSLNPNFSYSLSQNENKSKRSRSQICSDSFSNLDNEEDEDLDSLNINHDLEEYDGQSDLEEYFSVKSSNNPSVKIVNGHGGNSNNIIVNSKNVNLHSKTDLSSHFNHHLNSKQKSSSNSHNVNVTYNNCSYLTSSSFDASNDDNNSNEPNYVPTSRSHNKNIHCAKEKVRR
jgi:hypothetical protein